MWDLCTRGKNQQLLWNKSQPEWAINKQVHFGIDDLHWFYEVVLPDLRWKAMTTTFLVNGGSLMAGTPRCQARWMVYFMDNPNIKWMMTGGTPILGNHQMNVNSGGSHCGIPRPPPPPPSPHHHHHHHHHHCHHHRHRHHHPFCHFHVSWVLTTWTRVYGS